MKDEIIVLKDMKLTEVIQIDWPWYLTQTPYIADIATNKNETSALSIETLRLRRITKTLKPTKRQSYKAFALRTMLMLLYTMLMYHSRDKIIQESPTPELIDCILYPTINIPAQKRRAMYYYR